jgi:hypothetical protein
MGVFYMRVGTVRKFLLWAAMLCVGHPVLADEAFFATSWDTRTTLFFHVSDSVAQRLLPTGWESTPLADGVNLQLVFAESILVRYADGKTDGNERVATWVMPAKRKDSDQNGALVIGGFISSKEKAPGPYGVWSPAASADLTRSSSVTIDGQLSIGETWRFGSIDGDKIDFEVEFYRGPLSYAKAEAKVFSSAKDGFFRIYRIEQASEALFVGNPRFRRLSFKAEGPNVSKIFDGSERLVSVVSVPWFSRQTFLPR